VDSRRCLSYQSIENKKGPVPNDLAPFMELIFGCDICTSVCPHERDGFNFGLEPPPNPGPSDLGLEMICRMDDQKLSALLADTALLRTGPKVIRRNAELVLQARDQRGRS
jgi:epoxyqueuosine reductase QueG